MNQTTLMKCKSTGNTEQLNRSIELLLARTLFPMLKVQITKIKLICHIHSYRRWMYLGRIITYECMNPCCVSQSVSDPS